MIWCANGGTRTLRIQETLLHALNTSPTNWPTLIQDHALSLLRDGSCMSFQELIRQVMADIKSDTQTQAAQQKTNGATGGGGGTGGGAVKEGKGGGGGRAENGEGSASPTLALPKTVIEEGVRITRECLDAVVEVAE